MQFFSSFHGCDALHPGLSSSPLRSYSWLPSPLVVVAAPIREQQYLHWSGDLDLLGLDTEYG